MEKRSKAFTDIMEGLEFMRAHALGETKEGRTTVVDVKALDVSKVRQKTGLSQDRFADAFGLSASTLRGWEQGRTKPEGASRVLLTLIDREPATILRVLRLEPAKHAKAAPRARAAGKRHAAG